MSKLDELIKWLNNIDPEESKGSQLTNNDVDWLIQQALEKEYYEMLFHTYYDRCKDYFDKMEESNNNRDNLVDEIYNLKEENERLYGKINEIESVIKNIRNEV